MFKCFVKLSGAAIALALFAACSAANNTPLSIRFSADSTSIVLEHIDRAGLLTLQADTGKDSLLKELVSVLHTPSERDTLGREELVKGAISLKDNTIVFTPVHPFVKGNDYLVITFVNSRFGTPEQVVKGKLNLSVKPIQQLLTR